MFTFQHSLRFGLIIGLVLPHWGEFAPPVVPSLPGVRVPLYGLEVDQPSYLPPPLQFNRPGTPTATFVINYNPGVPASAQTAFQFAADIWAALISSPIPITVDVEWVNLPIGQLGGGGPNNYTWNFAGAPLTNTVYPAALANAHAGVDLFPNAYDIGIDFSSTAAWYFGADGQTPSGQKDFVSVALHEIGHGLGFAGSMKAGTSSTTAYWGSGTFYPYIYDRFAADGAGLLLISQYPTATWPTTGSTALMNELVGGDIRLTGPNLLAANSGLMPELHAESPWIEGRSYVHLDETTYPGGNLNSLMTPSIASMEAIHNPGPITLCFFKDMGWTVNVSAFQPAAPQSVSFTSATPFTTTTLYLPVIRNGSAGC